MSRRVDPKFRKLFDELARVGDRARMVEVAEGALSLAAFLAAGCLVVATTELALNLPGAGRAFLLTLLVGLATYALVRGMLVPAARPVTVEAVARRLEKARPEMGSRLINAVQLARSLDAIPHPALAEAAIGQGLNLAHRTNLAAAVKTRGLGRALRRALAACTVALAVFALVPASRVALRRVFFPARFIPMRVGGFEVTPGNAAVPAGERVTVRATVALNAPGGAVAYIYIRSPGRRAETRRRMVVDRQGAGAYTYLFPSLRSDTEYRVEVGPCQSERYRLTVAERPEVAAVDLEYRYPPHTGLASRVAAGTNGEIQCPVGTRVRLTVRANRPVQSGRVEGAPVVLARVPGQADWLAGTLEIRESGTYRIFVTDEEGLATLDPPHRAIRAEPDRAPRIDVVAPGRDLVVPLGAEVAVAFNTSDDFGLARARLVFRRGRGGETILVRAWGEIPKEGRIRASFSHVWRLGEKDFEPGERLLWHAEAEDGRPAAMGGPGVGRSREFAIRIQDPARARASKADALASLAARIRALIAKQESARALLAKAPASALGRVADAQGEIRAGALAAAALGRSDDLELARMASALDALAGGLLAAAEEEAARLAAARAAPGLQARASLDAKQVRIVEAFKRLLDITGALTEKVEGEDEKGGADLPDDVREKLEKLRAGLDEFLDEQRKVIEGTEDLAKRPVDDLTDEEKAKLAALAATEDKWEKFLKGALSDLSKLPKQDFTDAQLLKELVETVAQVELAEDALVKKAAEIAVPIEQAGLELAETMTTHIEKWLADKPDRDAWSMEEPIGEIDAPLAELPSELEDLIGDLIEEEEDIFEEMEDASSAWADSLDKGAGWETADGPISNMSAQGVTGNVLPNQSEIGGRSGEGRTGKASGEMVSETAVGKGGRRTPSRLTPDSYVGGEIKDTSGDPAGGATGGGKVGGAGGEGLEGPAPPDGDRNASALAGRQAQLRNKAERIQMQLKLMNAPSADLDRVIAKMRELEGTMKDGRYANIAREKKMLLKGLGNAREFARAVAHVRHEAGFRLPKGLEEEILDTRGGRTPPEGYEDIVEQYYRAIARE